VKAFLLAVALPVAAAVLFVALCSGPKPSVEGASLAAVPGGYRVTAAVENRGGEGEIQVTFRLRDRRTGRTLPAEAEAPVRRGERVQVSALVPAPPGDYAVEAEAEYPPR
jgi:hypothetical protein